MNSYLRKFFIWFLSLLLVIGVYLLYTRYNGTPAIDIETESALSEGTDNSKVISETNQMGEVGSVKIGPVKGGKLYELDKKTKQVVQEIGFEKVLHIEGKEWELEKPTVNIYKPDFKCYITAEKGKMLIQDAVGRTSSKDVTLSGNVVFHIVPTSSGNIPESFLYLDDLFYKADTSTISTHGPVRFVSADAQLNGKGLQLVYNNKIERLEYLRIKHLDDLKIRTKETSILSSRQDERKNGDNNQAKSAGDKTNTARQTMTANTSKTQGKQRKYYKCILRDNVIVETPEQVIAADEMVINNILYSAGSDDETQNQPAEKKTSKRESIEKPGSSASTKKPEQKELRNLTDTVVTCEDGITITPTKNTDSFETIDSGGDIGDSLKSEIIQKARNRNAFIARRIVYDASGGNILAGAESVLMFSVKDMEEPGLNVPVEVTSQKKVSFLRDKNQVIFKGDCLCSMVQEKSGIQRKHTLSAEKITVYLAEQGDKSSASSEIKHITADGGIVQLTALTKRAKELLSGIQLKCARFDYDANSKSYLAAGPGEIEVDNSKISEPNEQVSKYSLQKRCYALIENFDTLEYLIDTNQIIADAQAHQINIGYAPVIEAGYGLVTKVNAGRVEAQLQGTSEGRLEISELYATGGIRYQRENIEFEGSQMIFDANDSIVRVRGNDMRPCLLNGALVDGIEYNIKTGKTKTKVVAPGMFRLGR